jgi:hypothetical protein
MQNVQNIMQENMQNMTKNMQKSDRSIFCICYIYMQNMTEYLYFQIRVKFHHEFPRFAAQKFHSQEITTVDNGSLCRIS